VKLMEVSRIQETNLNNVNIINLGGLRQEEEKMNVDKFLHL